MKRITLALLALGLLVIAPALLAPSINTSARCSASGTCEVGDANTDAIQLTTDGSKLDVDASASNSVTITTATTETAQFRGADAAGAANTQFDTTGAGSITIGSNDVTTITLNTDDTGDGTDVVLPAGSIGTTEILDGTIGKADLADAGFGAFSICGEATTVNNNTVYYGPDVTLLGTSGSEGITCDINAAGNTTEATADAPILTNQAFAVSGMTCRNEADADADISFTLRTAAGATVPSVTCTISDGERDCVADVQTTTDIAAGATVAVAAASTSDIADANGFVCSVSYTY